MWFRIEFNKDGSVASCAQTDLSLRSGRRVIYVEADSEAAAITLAASRYRQWLLTVKKHRDKTREGKKLRGICRDCSREATAGSSYCQTHQDKRRESKRDSKRRMRAGEPKRTSGVTGTRDRSTLDARKELELLREIQLKLLDDPERLRVWLTVRIAELSKLLGAAA